MGYLFSTERLVNVIYGRLKGKRDENRTSKTLPRSLHDLGLSSAMAAMWIGSLYLYGMGAIRMGTSGTAVGWPTFTSVSIAVGMLWGFWKGEWSGAPASARSLLLGGLLLIVAAVLVFAFGNAHAPD